MDSDAKRTILLLKMKSRFSDEHSILNYGNPVSWSYVLAMAEKLYTCRVIELSSVYYIILYLFVIISPCNKVISSFSFYRSVLWAALELENRP